MILHAGNQEIICTILCWEQPLLHHVRLTPMRLVQLGSFGRIRGGEREVLYAVRQITRQQRTPPDCLLLAPANLTAPFMLCSHDVDSTLQF